MDNTLKKWINRDRIIGILCILAGFSGFLYTILGDFSEGAGIGAHLLPQLSFLVILATGVSLIIDRRESFQPKGDIVSVTSSSVMIFSVIGLVYFLCVLYIGLVVSTFLYSCGMFSLLTVNPRKNWKPIVIPGAIITLFIWIIFTRVLSIVLPNPILF